MTKKEEERLDRIAIGARIEAYRKAKGMNILQMAGKIGINSYQSYRSRELGNLKFSTKELSQIAQILQVDLSQIVEGRHKVQIDINDFKDNSMSDPYDRIIQNISTNLFAIKNIHILKSIDSLVMAMTGQEAVQMYERNLNAPIKRSVTNASKLTHPNA